MTAQHKKDALQYSIDICKLFITLATAGVAYIVNIIVTGTDVGALLKWGALSLLAASVGCGVYCLMRATHSVGTGVYDIDITAYRYGAIFQILFFLGAMAVLCWWALFLDHPPVSG